MLILYCDICEMPIKDTEKVYVLSLREAPQNQEEINDPNDVYDFLKKIQDKTDKREICSKCKAVFDKFIKLRRSEVKKLHKKIKYLEEDEVDGNV